MSIEADEEAEGEVAGEVFGGVPHVDTQFREETYLAGNPVGVADIAVKGEAIAVVVFVADDFLGKAGTEEGVEVAAAEAFGQGVADVHLDGEGGTAFSVVAIVLGDSKEVGLCSDAPDGVEGVFDHEETTQAVGALVDVGVVGVGCECTVAEEADAEGPLLVAGLGVGLGAEGCDGEQRDSDE